MLTRSGPVASRLAPCILVLVLQVTGGCGGADEGSDPPGDASTGHDDLGEHADGFPDDSAAEGHDATSTGGPTDDGAVEDTSSTAPSGGINPVFFTVAGHIEDNLSYADCAVYEQKRAQLLQLADVIAAAGVDFNLQVSYEWLLGLSACETPAVRGSTGGANVIDHLAEHYDFEIDVHQEGASVRNASSGNNFADIRYLGGQLTDHMSETTGFQWDNPVQYTHLQAGEAGILHPSFTWRPEVLAGGASVDHTHGDFSRDMTSVGVWIPSDFSEAGFHVHDTSPAARMVYVGSGPNQHVADWGPPSDCHWTTTADFVAALADSLEDGDVDPDGIVTATLFVPQSILFNPPRHADLTAILAQIAPLAAAHRVEYAHFTEVVQRWRDDYGATPSIVRYDQIDPARRTCD